MKRRDFKIYNRQVDKVMTKIEKQVSSNLLDEIWGGEWTEDLFRSLAGIDLLFFHVCDVIELTTPFDETDYHDH